MIRNVHVSLTGKCALLMNKYAGEMPSEEKPPRGRKTQSHIDTARRRKWERAAYWDDAEKRFHIPAENIEAMLAAGATRFRMGKDFKREIQVVTLSIPLLNKAGVAYGGGELLDWFRPEHVDIRGVVIQRARVDACRPIFHDWRVDFDVEYTDTVTKDQIAMALSRNNLGDFRPRFGQFDFSLS